MDITRGSLDEISRPASKSRINHGTKVLSTSLEVLTPEPDPFKVDFYSDHTEDKSVFSHANAEECGVMELESSQEISEQKTNSGFQLVIQDENQVEVTVKSTNLNDSKEKDVDLLILKAIKKMKKLDEILANKQSQERAIKKQGRELRRKLWEEFQSTASRSSSVITEEVENTSRYLALSSPLPETLDSSAVQVDEVLVGVFHTQINPENYAYSGRQSKQGCLSESKTRSSMKKMENMNKKREASCKSSPDFVKKNIEMAKDSANTVVMLEEEKKRLIELFRDTEEETNELQVIEKDTTGWLVPGEGYTPEPVEYCHLTEINAKLEVVTSNGDLAAVHNSCSEVPSQIYQESLAYANRKLETIPGEKVLRDTKEERDQQNRLKEIDQQLKILEGTPDVLPYLSEEQLNALLEACMQNPRIEDNLALTKSQGSFLERITPCCDVLENSIPDSRNEILDDVQSGTVEENQEVVGAEHEDEDLKHVIETSDFNLSKVLLESHLREKKENNQENQEETAHNSSSEGYYMSKALSTDKPKKPSFLDEPFYCINMNNELSTDVNIPSIPLKTGGDELKTEDVHEE